MYTQEQVEKLLALHSGLVRRGLDPDYAELRVLRLTETIDEIDVRKTAQQIADDSEDRWKQPESGTSESGGNYFDNLRRHLEAERGQKRSEKQKIREKLEQLP
jgi:hypothetical protein